MQVTRDDIQFMKSEAKRGMEPNDVVSTRERMNRILHDLEKGHEFQDALKKIATTMGRVCPDYETCDHAPCDDSCGAVLLALEALKDETDETKSEELARAHREVSLLTTAVLNAWVKQDVQELARLITKGADGWPVVTLEQAQK